MMTVAEAYHGSAARPLSPAPLYPAVPPATPALPEPGSRVGLIHNPRSTANRGRAPLRAVHVPWAAPETRAELRATLRAFARKEVRTIAVSGGDGTVREVLTALPGAYAREPMPAVAVLPAGRTDLIAGNVGARPSTDGLGRLLAGVRQSTLRATHRPVIRIEHAVDTAGESLTVRGMLFGCAAFTYGTKLAQGDVHATGASHRTAIALTVAEMFRRFVVGELQTLMAGEPMSFRADGKPDEAGLDAKRFLFMASTLEDGFAMGRDLFWGEADPNAIRYLDVPAPARNVPRALGAFLMGRPWRAGPGYRSGAAHSMEIDVNAPFVVDGELFHAPKGGRIQVSVDPAVTFVAP